MYNLIEYSDNYSKTLREPNDNLIDSELFKSK